MTDSSTKWETASAYLAALPNGLDSFPDELLRMDVVQPMVEELQKTDADHPVTAQVLARVAAHEADYVPEVWLQALSARLAERLGPDAYFDWARRDSLRLVDRPFFRPLMRVLSPTLLLMGTARRWGALRKGTNTLSSGPVAKSEGRKSAELLLTFPPGLFTTAFLDSLGPSFSVLVEAARGSDPEVVRSAGAPGESRYRLSWS